MKRPAEQARAQQQQQERLTVNQQVYYNDAKRGWLRGVVRQLDGDKATVENNETHETCVIAARQVHGFLAESYDATDSDLFHVSDLHVSTLLYCIKERFERLHAQYSVMGEMVLSVNPFQLMAINGEQERRKYLGARDVMSLPPHIWQVAHTTYNAITRSGLGNQSVVISGESGSGKTENTKSLIAYLGQLSNMRTARSSKQHSIAEEIDARLTWSNPVMESFGNARTVRNDNSSRFGKYIKLYFDTDTGVMIGGETVTYLLERSRIILQSPGERNYHIFYEMLAGLSPQEKRELGNLKTARDYRCLSGGNTFTRRGVDGHTLNDAEEFATVRRALARIGVSAELERGILRVLAAILHLLEVRFGADANDKARIIDEGEFLVGCKLLQLNPEQVRECFLVKNRTSLVTILASQGEAEGFRNSFCKAIYVGLFDRLVEFVNASIRPHSMTGGSSSDTTSCESDKTLSVSSPSVRYIGLLDIFGFENFARNSFEQLCINYANESLQNHYNKYTFLNDEEECRQEGIAIPKIDFPDNSECIRMFDERPNGIFCMLDEECHFKAGTAERFTMNLWEHWRGRNTYFVQPKSTTPNAFGLNHYAAYVPYNTDEWLEKNVDALKEDMYTCIAASKDEFVRALLSTEKSEERRKLTVAIRFQRQLRSLRDELEATETKFIRCIKPNAEASATYLANDIVGTQLESAGVLQTISLKRQGYPVRRTLEHFCRYLYPIMPRNAASLYRQARQLTRTLMAADGEAQMTTTSAGGAGGAAAPLDRDATAREVARLYTAVVKSLLERYQRYYGWTPPHYAVGKSKVFLRAEVWSALERLLLRRRAQLLARCKPALRAWVAEYRERKRIERERRLAELRRQRELREAKAAACAHGLPADKLAWLSSLTSIFPDAPLDTVLDTAAEADTREEALAWLTQLEAHRVDAHTPRVLDEMLARAEVRREVRDMLRSSDVTTVAALAELSPQVLRTQYRCNDVECLAIARALADLQTQQAKCNELLQQQAAAAAAASNGSAAAARRPSASAAERAAVASEEQRHSDAFDAKVRALQQMGFAGNTAQLVLAHYNGDVDRTVARLLYGVNMRAVTRHVQKHKNYTTAHPSVQRLIAMGASKSQAKQALRTCNGDANRAVSKLFTATPTADKAS